MADTATTRNRLRKPEPGANLNTWGPLLNEGAVDRADEALDGVAGFTLSGSKTLTSTNYVTDEARMRIINITGGTGGTVTIPAVEKWYLVRNGTSGDVIISNGSNSVTLATGEINAVLTNGTTIYAANSKTYVDAAILSASISAVLPSQSGNAGKFVKTDGAIASWAAIAIADVASLQATLDLKATIASPTFTGNPAAPTPTLGDNDTSIATTAFVQAAIAALVASSPAALDTLNELAAALGNDASFATTVTNALALKAAIASPTFTGTPAAPTAALGTNTTQIATTAFVLANAVNWTQIGSPVSTASGTAWSFTSIAGTGRDLKFVLNGVSHSGGGTPDLTMEVSDDNGATWSTAQPLVAAANSSGVVYGAIIVDNYATAAGIGIVQSGVVNSAVEPDLRGSGANLMFHLAGGAINAVRFRWTGGETGDAGTITLFGR